MPRANRYFKPGYIWHITHRCHKKEFLLKFLRDRKRWLHWLFEAKKRFGLIVLDYSVTSNHIHLLVKDNGAENVIPKSLQLIAGQTGQEFNKRKNRKGAFWEDRYHATAIEEDQHLAQCIVYIDLNMVRAGAVTHPSEWLTNGYNEIQNPKGRYSIIDIENLMNLFNFSDLIEFQKQHREWVEDVYNNDLLIKNDMWSESIAVGNKQFVDKMISNIKQEIKRRKVRKMNSSYVVREPISSYNTDFNTKKGTLRGENAHLWNVSL